MIQSPFKAKLIRRTADLTPLETRDREIVGVGNHSVVLSDGHHHVLLVTRYTIAKNNLELLRRLNSRTCPFALPILVGSNVDLATMINPLKPLKAQKSFKSLYSLTYPEIWHENVVYKMPKYDGTLEDLKSIRFNEESIALLEKTLTASLKFLHKRRLTHNDLSLKNIFYSGELPNLQFHLGDFGSVTENNDAENHSISSQKDMHRLRRIVEKASEILSHKRNLAEVKKENDKYVFNTSKKDKIFSRQFKIKKEDKVFIPEIEETKYFSSKNNLRSLP